MHQEKIWAIIEWPTLKNVTMLRVFLGICTYYRWFVKEFSLIVIPLIDLTKKDSFVWLDATQNAFTQMKEVMSNFHVLALPNFSQPFVLECDALGDGIRAILM